MIFFEALDAFEAASLTQIVRVIVDNPPKTIEETVARVEEGLVNDRKTG